MLLSERAACYLDTPDGLPAVKFLGVFRLRVFAAQTRETRAEGLNPPILDVLQTQIHK